MPLVQNIPDLDITVTLLNMGGPRTIADVREFQRRLFSDPLLIRFPGPGILQGLFARMLSSVRAEKTGKRYQMIGGGSPIFLSTQCQAQALQEELKSRRRDLDVTFTFNYSDPLPDTTVRRMKEAGKKYILPLSLYPQYSQATTGSSLDHLKKAAQQYYPEAKFLRTPAYYLHEGYIRAFCERILEAVQSTESLKEFYLLFSAHGIPLYFVKEGDPYPEQIEQTASRIIRGLGFSGEWGLSYQGAVGPMKWLGPSTEETLAAAARRGTKKIVVIPVSFVTDHIETLWEVDIYFRAIAGKAGIRDFRMVRAIECHPGFITALADTVEQALSQNDGPLKPTNGANDVR
jgi:ferrochelatase